MRTGFYTTLIMGNAKIYTSIDGKLSQINFKLIDKVHTKGLKHSNKFSSTLHANWSGKGQN